VRARSGSPCFPARTRLPTFARMWRSRRKRWFSRGRCPSSSRSVGPSMRLPRPDRLASPKWKPTALSARTPALALRVCVQIAPDRPSVAGTPAVKRFGTGHQMPQNSTSRCQPNRVISGPASGDGSHCPASFGRLPYRPTENMAKVRERSQVLAELPRLIPARALARGETPPFA
jgi:hypothetical protein